MENSNDDSQVLTINNIELHDCKAQDLNNSLNYINGKSAILDANNFKNTKDKDTENDIFYRPFIETISEKSSSSDCEILTNNEKQVKRRKKRIRKLTPEAKYRKKKLQDIEEVLSSDPLDIERIRQLAIEEGGLLKDEIRRKAWPKLMFMDKIEFSPKPADEDIKAHKDYNQVVLDVQRSLKRFPPGIDSDYRLVLMDQLTVLIIRILMKHPELCYYQGFHDVAVTFLLVVGENVGYELVEHLCINYLKEFMTSTMERTVFYLTYFYPILRSSHPKLYSHIEKADVGTMFCLPWLITWYAHTLSDYRNVVRLYDFFLASPYLMPMYLAVAIVIEREDEVLCTECDMALLHHALSQVPDTLPFEAIIEKSQKLYNTYPPSSLDEEVKMLIDKRNAKEAALNKATQLKKSKSYGLTVFHLSGRQFLKIVFLAVTATLATSLFGYYTQSSLFASFLTWD